GVRVVVSVGRPGPGVPGVRPRGHAAVGAGGPVVDGPASAEADLPVPVAAGRGDCEGRWRLPTAGDARGRPANGERAGPDRRARGDDVVAVAVPGRDRVAGVVVQRVPRPR